MNSKIICGQKLQCTPNCSMGEFFFNCADRFGDKICQIDANLNQKESYYDVGKRSVRVALELQNRGITNKDVIVMCTKVTLDNVIPILASFYIGSKVANLDPSLSVRHTTHLLGLVSPKVIFVEEESVDLIEESLKCANIQTKIVVFGRSTKYPTFSEFVKPQEKENSFKPTKVDINDTSVIFFSSGTTGLPKAICHSHYSFLNVAYSFNEGGVHCDVVLSFTSFYWVSGMILLTSSFLDGGHRIFCGPIEAEKTFQVINKYKVTYMFLAPILTYKFTNFENHLKFNTSSVKTVTIGGTPINPEQLKRMSAIFKCADFLFVYGLSEAGVVTFFNPKTEQNLIKQKIGSCGTPAPGVSIKVVDFKNQEQLGPNQKGEICIKGPTIMKGYYKQDSTTVFDRDGFLKSGDIGYYDKDKCFYIIERMKEMFKYLSWHVVPSSIESVILEHPAVKESVVFGTPKSEEEGELPTACVIVKENCKVTEKEIQEFVAQRVSDYEKLRGGVIFVKELLKTPSGKLMRKEIRNNILKK